MTRSATSDATTTPPARTLRREPLAPPPCDLPPLHPLRRVGQTPLFELDCLTGEMPGIRILGKAEWANPGGSVKDRPALNMILHGIADGALTSEKPILDATSGNTGIAYAMIAAALGYRVTLCLPQSTGKLHQRILKGYGANLVFTPATEGSDGAQREAMRLYDAEPEAYFYPDQYNNDANWSAHYHGTAAEILEQTDGTVTHFLAGMGTSGTFTGVTRRLKEHDPAIQCLSFQPDSPMHALEGLKHMPTSIKPGFYDEAMADENLWVRTEDAQAMVKRIASEQGLLLGTSAGAAVAGAYQLGQRLHTSGEHAVIVTILCDAASKYLDQTFWA